MNSKPLTLPPGEWVDFALDIPPKAQGRVLETPEGNLFAPVGSAPFYAISAADQEVPIGLAYFQAGARDCVRACLATYFQIPPEDVPDTDIGTEQYELVAEFANGLGYEIERVHRAKGTPEGFWLGGTFNGRADESHCVVMYGSKVAFDPATAFRAGGEFVPSQTYRISTGTAFTPKKEN